MFIEADNRCCNCVFKGYKSDEYICNITGKTIEDHLKWPGDVDNSQGWPCEDKCPLQLNGVIKVVDKRAIAAALKMQVAKRYGELTRTAALNLVLSGIEQERYIWEDNNE